MKLRHYVLYLTASVLFAIALDISMLDDGLRHIAFAVHQDSMHSWGEVFPHSLFGSYDPWHLWHSLLGQLSHIVSYRYIQIYVNTFILFILMILVHMYLRKVVSYSFGSMIYVVVFVIVAVFGGRYWMMRPDALSGLYVFAVLLLPNRILPALVLALLYGPFYYLFFLYMGSVGLVFMVQQKWRAFIGTSLGAIAVGMYFLFSDFDGYIETLFYVLTDQSLREGLVVTEGEPLFSLFSLLDYTVAVPLFLGMASLQIYKRYSYFKKHTLVLFLVITAVLWINQIRYFALFLPFMVVCFLSFWIEMNFIEFLENTKKKWGVFKQDIKRIRFIIDPLTVIYMLVVTTLMLTTFSYTETVERKKYFKESFFMHKTILMNSMNLDLYSALYHNPTMHIVPSCGIGWFDDADEKMKDIYIRMQKKKGITEEEISKLLRYVDADIYIHYIKREGARLRFAKLKELGIIPLEIYDNHIVFSVEKETNHE